MGDLEGHIKALRAKGDEGIRLIVRNPSAELTSVMAGNKRLAAVETIELPPLNENAEPLARLDLDVTFGKGTGEFLEVDRRVEVEIQLGKQKYRDVLYPDTRGHHLRYRVVYEDPMPGLIYCQDCDDVVIARCDGRCGQHG